MCWFPQILVIEFYYNQFLLNMIPRTTKPNILLSYPNAVFKCLNLKAHIYSIEMGVRRLFIPIITISKVTKHYQNLQVVFFPPGLHCNEKKGKKSIFWIHHNKLNSESVLVHWDFLLQLQLFFLYRLLAC